MTKHPVLPVVETLLYRGNSQVVAMFDIGKTSVRGLFGPGLYLTDDAVIAHDYTAARGDERVFPPNRYLDGDTKLTTVKDLLRHYVEWRSQSGFNESEYSAEWRRARGISPYAGMNERMFRDYYEDRDAARAALMQANRAKVVQELRADLPNLRVSRLTTGELVLLRHDRQAAVSAFDIPEDYLARTLHTDRPLPDSALKVIRGLWKTEFPDGRSDLRDHREKAVSFDAYVAAHKRFPIRRAWAEDGDLPVGGNGQNPSLDTLRNGTHAGHDVFVDSMFDDSRTKTRRFIAAMQKLGYVGLEYDGGKRLGSYVRGGGGREHRAFVFWNMADLAKFRVQNAEMPALDPVDLKAVPRNTRPRTSK